MELFISFILGCISSLVISLFFPILREGILSYITRLQQLISNDPINLSGPWKANFSETDHENNTFESEELINLKHYGTFFEATGNIKGKYPRVFNYTGKVYNNLLWGFYQKENTEPGSLEGKGVFLIKVSDEKDKMNGYCAFHDKDSGRIENSEYA